MSEAQDMRLQQRHQQLEARSDCVYMRMCVSLGESVCECVRMYVCVCVCVCVSLFVRPDENNNRQVSAHCARWLRALRWNRRTVLRTVRWRRANERCLTPLI